MKKRIIGCATALSSLASVNADLTFTAPGMNNPYVTTEISKTWSTSLGTYWKYIITGYDYQLSAGVPDGGKVSGGKLRYKTGNAQFPGLTTITATVNGQTVVSGSLNATDISDTSGQISYTFNSPITLTEQSVTPLFTISTNMVGANDYISIRGSALSAPPIPVGELTAPRYVISNGSTTLGWFISKSLEGEGTTEEEDPPSIVDNDTPNVGEGKSNNGHGNNVDGIDVSNPGKSAAKWAQKGIYDTDYDGDGIPEDDEGHGGGSAMSKSPNTNS